MDPNKRRQRQLKRQIKKAGSRHRRRRAQRDLAQRPDEAHWSEEDLGHHRSRDFNGLDRPAGCRPDAE